MPERELVKPKFSYGAKLSTLALASALSVGATAVLFRYDIPQENQISVLESKCDGYKARIQKDTDCVAEKTMLLRKSKSGSENEGKAKSALYKCRDDSTNSKKELHKVEKAAAYLKDKNNFVALGAAAAGMVSFVPVGLLIWQGFAYLRTKEKKEDDANDIPQTEQ